MPNPCASRIWAVTPALAAGPLDQASGSERKWPCSCPAPVAQLVEHRPMNQRLRGWTLESEEPDPGLQNTSVLIIWVISSKLFN